MINLSEYVTILNTYAPSCAVHNSINSILMELKTEINTNPIMVDDVSTPRSPINRPCAQKISRGTSELNDVLQWI